MRNTADTWCVPIHGPGERGRLSSAIYFQSNDKESCGFYGMIFEYRVMASYHVAVISEMIIKIWAVDREFIDPNSRLGSDPTSGLTHPYSLRIQQIRANQTVCYISRSHSQITRDTCDTRDNVSPVKLRHALAHTDNENQTKFVLRLLVFKSFYQSSVLLILMMDPSSVASVIIILIVRVSLAANSPGES